MRLLLPLCDLSSMCIAPAFSASSIASEELFTVAATASDLGSSATAKRSHPIDRPQATPAADKPRVNEGTIAGIFIEPPTND
jgi:hypothetical protein